MLRSACKFTNLLNVASRKPMQPIRCLRQARTETKTVNHVESFVSTGAKTKIGSMEVGQMAVAGASATALGALCFYGLGLSSSPGAVDTMGLWPDYVRQRISSTYMHLGGSLATTAAAAIGIYRSPHGQRLMHLCDRHPIMSTVGIIAAMIGSGMVMRAIPYDSTPTKYAAWAVHNGILGLAIAPICAVGGALALRAAWYTTGVVGGLSAIAVCAPSDQFLGWAGPLSIGLGAVFVACLGSAFLPPTSALAMPLHSIALYGGLILFSCFLLYDTQKVIHKAVNHQDGGHVWTGTEWAPVRRYDPINAANHLVMDILNIFIRIVQVLAMGGGRKK